MSVRLSMAVLSWHRWRSSNSVTSLQAIILIWVISTHNIFHGNVITVENTAGVEFVAFWLAFYRLEKT